MECSFPVPGVFFCRQFNVNVLQNRLINSQLLSKKRQRSVVFIFVVIYLLISHRKASGFETFVSVNDAVSDHALAIQLIASSKVISLQSSERFQPFGSCLKAVVVDVSCIVH